MARSNKPPKPAPVRLRLIGQARNAGYHDDMRTLVRLIVERGSRITQGALRQAYTEGARLKASGHICDCFHCKRERPAAPTETG